MIQAVTAKTKKGEMEEVVMEEVEVGEEEEEEVEEEEVLEVMEGGKTEDEDEDMNLM